MEWEPSNVNPVNYTITSTEEADLLWQSKKKVKRIRSRGASPSQDSENGDQVMEGTETPRELGEAEEPAIMEDARTSFKVALTDEFLGTW